mmetsp:Transcript_36807/g.88749  ORF Transcript_36807/g.88749 Transcript_36807/m.88749 type:complete len:1082 (+) Transcript_36807:321-3566(+)
MSSKTTRISHRIDTSPPTPTPTPTLFLTMVCSAGRRRMDNNTLEKMHSPAHFFTDAPSLVRPECSDIGSASCEVENIMQSPKRYRHRRGRRRRRVTDAAAGLDDEIIMPIAVPSRCTHGNITMNMTRPLILLISTLICSVVLGWNPSPSRLPLPSGSQQSHHLNSRPTTRIKYPSTRKSLQLSATNQSGQASPSLDTKHSNSHSETRIDNEINQQIDRLIQCLHSEETNESDSNVSKQVMDILMGMMALYTNWCSSDRPSIQLKFKASANIDRAFRLVTNEAFSAPHQLSWVNLGMQVLQLQLHTDDFHLDRNINGDSAVNGLFYRLIPLQRPYDAIPKGTWLKALRALTSYDMNFSHSSSYIRSIESPLHSDDAQWITPSNSAFRILQRLVANKGIRTFYNKKRRSTQQHRQSLDERDFNMVLQAYATLSKNSHMHASHRAHMFAAHRVMALQERTPHAPPLSPVAYSILIKAYGQWKDVENVEMTILNAQRNGIVPDIIMANTVLDAYVNCEMLDKAQKICRSMTASKGRDSDGSHSADGGGGEQGFWPLLKPNARTYNTLLKGMAEEGDLHSATALSREVQSRGLWDSITTNTLVKAAVTAQKFDRAETILTNHTTSATSHRSKFDHPNIEAYTELLDGYAKDGQLEKALQLMQLMQTRGVTPNEYTYTCMVGALAHNNKVRQARKMINYAASLQPSAKGRSMVLTPTYNAFISGLLSDNQNYNVEMTGQSSHAGNIVEVLAVLQEMQGLNIHPNVVTVALVVDGLGKCSPPRCNEARELVQHLEFTSRAKQNRYHKQDGKKDGKGISLSNKKIATALIGAYGRSNDLDAALELFARIIPEPDVVAFNALLDAYCQNDQLKLALDLFRKNANFHEWNEQEEAYNMHATSKSSQNVKRRQQIYIKPDVVTYTTLISALLQLKSRAATKRAIFLYSEMKEKWWISPDTILVDTILNTMISGGPIGFEDSDVKFTLLVLRDGSRLEWERGQYEKRKKAVRGILVGCSSEVWKNDEFAFGLVSEEPDDTLFEKKGWNKIDSGFRLWGGGGDLMQQVEGDGSSVDSFLASKGWNDIDSGFRFI